MDLPANVAYLYKILGKVLAGRIVNVITSIVRLTMPGKSTAWNTL